MRNNDTVYLTAVRQQATMFCGPQLMKDPSDLHLFHFYLDQSRDCTLY